MENSAPQTVSVLAPDISCMHCVRAIEERLSALEGISSVQADASTKKVDITFDPSTISLHKIGEELADEGYPVQQ